MDMRIVSFLPSATEMVCALGLSEQLIGVTHECDYPPEVRSKPVVVRSAIETKGLRPEEIDEAVARMLRTGRSLYTVDEEILTKLRPDLILTQSLCQVCAPSGNEIGRVLTFLPTPPQIVWLTPRSLTDIFDNIRQVGDATDRSAEATGLIGKLQGRVRAVEDRTSRLSTRPRVFCMEWFSPPYNAGHWMPELVELAGGVDGLGSKGRDSTRLTWEQILDYDPEVLILSPCGFHLDDVLLQAHLLTRYRNWDTLSAVKGARVYAVDADSYFARPGPRVVDGLELIAHMIHPEIFDWRGPGDAYRKLSAEALSAALDRT